MVFSWIFLSFAAVYGIAWVVTQNDRHGMAFFAFALAAMICVVAAGVDDINDRLDQLANTPPAGADQ